MHFRDRSLFTAPHIERSLSNTTLFLIDMAFVSSKPKVMDWCFSEDRNYQIVLKEEELTYGFTPPDSLQQQIVCRPESYADLDRYTVGESKLTIDELSLNMQALSYDVNRGEVVYGLGTVNQFPAVDCCNEILEGLAPKKTGLLGDVLEQLDGAGAINRADDTFLVSQPISMQLDSQTAFNSHLTTASQSIPFDESTSMLGAGVNKSSPNLEVPADAITVCPEEMEYMDEERKMEEMLLQDLELVIRQMTRDTRVCVRDALYRLAKRSKDNVLSFVQNGEILMDVPALSSINPHETLRSGGMHHIESESNAIDRTIANLMFTEVSCEQADMSCITL